MIYLGTINVSDLLLFVVLPYLFIFPVFTISQIHTVEVTGSNPVSPTRENKGLQA